MDSVPASNRYALLLHGSPAGADDVALAQSVPTQALSVVEILSSGTGRIAKALWAAKQLGCTHAVTIPADRPLKHAELQALLASAEANPAGIVLGTQRVAIAEDRMSHLLLRLETGLRIDDLRGPRVYPLHPLGGFLQKRPRGMEEFEILVRAAWAGCSIVETPIPLDAQSRFFATAPIPLRRKLHMFLRHARLIARALIAVRHRRSHPAPGFRQQFWRNLGHWLNPFAAWRELREGGASRNEMAVGLAVGAFIGNMPAWGLHTFISLFVAKRLHLNPLAVMTGSHVSAPPMGPFLVALAMWTGHVILHGSPPRWHDIWPLRGLAQALPLFVDWSLGAVLVGTAVAAGVYLVANFLFRFIERRAVAAAPRPAKIGPSP